MRFYNSNLAFTSLLSGLAIFPKGEGDKGGTYGILRHFPSLRDLIDMDLDEQGSRIFRAILFLIQTLPNNMHAKGLPPSTLTSKKTETCSHFNGCFRGTLAMLMNVQNRLKATTNFRSL